MLYLNNIIKHISIIKQEKENLDLGQKLMLLQGISLIQDGLQFIEWVEDMPNELAHDVLSILRERFQLLQECVLDGSADHLLIDRIKTRMENIQYGHELNQKIQEQLQQLRSVVITKQHHTKESTP